MVSEVLIDALLDTVKILPVLLAVYLLVEFLEHRHVFSFTKKNLLTGNASPVFGSLFGVIPQCGFSVVSTDLFAKRKLSVGALVAVYVSTSDEALPILIADGASFSQIAGLLAIKAVWGIVAGYLAMLLYKIIFKAPVEAPASDASHQSDCECTHCARKGGFILDALLHTAKIAAFVLAANIVLGFLVELVGTDNLSAFLNATLLWQPLFAVIIGLIPNCAASVILTEFYLMDSLSLGALIGGLCVNAGLGLPVLFKQNKSFKQNLFILSFLILSSLLIAYLVILFTPAQ